MTRVQYPYKVLIADDEEEIREIVAYQFQKHGCQVFLASTGDEAFRVIQEQFPEIIISDIRMPSGTGMELLRRIRRVDYPGHSRPHVYIMTGLLEKGEGYLIALGVRKIFLKPFDVVTTIAGILGDRASLPK